jgi:hypothetical protein
MADERKTVGQPHDRLTRMADAMTTAMERHPEYRKGDRAILFLEDDDKGGIVLTGYDSDVDAMSSLFIHLKAIFKVNGRELMVIPIGNG